MIRVAIVDDDKTCQMQIKGYIEKYAKEAREEFAITVFDTAMDFITDYKAVYGIVFLDIEMPLIDGMSAARKLRLIDNEVCIIFITKMAKYAIEGYEVDAAGFIVKPVRYFDFIDKLKKAVKICESRKTKNIMLKSDGNIMRVPVSQIYFVEKNKNYLIFNTSRGEIRQRGTLENAEKELRQYGFSMCNSGCLVNLSLIQQVTATDVIVNGIKLPLAFRRVKLFKIDMLNYLRGNSM